MNGLWTVLREQLRQTFIEENINWLVGNRLLELLLKLTLNVNQSAFRIVTGFRFVFKLVDDVT